MAKRELSSTLKNLKFMQRAALKENETKKEEEVEPEEIFPTSSTTRKKCVVIMEGDPLPGVVKGRMSFLGFNPSIDKLHAESNIHHPIPLTASTANQTGEGSFRSNEFSVDADGVECLKNNDEIKDDIKRKQSDSQRSNKPSSNGEGDKQSARKNNGSFKKPKLDWNLLRPSTFKDKKGDSGSS